MIDTGAETTGELETLMLDRIREREHFLEILKIQVDDIILPWVADAVPMYWWVLMS